MIFVAVFARIVPDALGLRPAFAIWKDWVEYDKSLHMDGGESYAMAHMSLMDVKDAVRAKSLGLTTKKLEASRTVNNINNNIEESVHDQVIREAAMGKPTDDDVFFETCSKYEGMLNKGVAQRKSQRIIESIPYELPTSSPARPLGSLGKNGRYDLLGDDDEDVKLLQMEYGLGVEVDIGRNRDVEKDEKGGSFKMMQAPPSPSALDRARRTGSFFEEEKKDEKVGPDPSNRTFVESDLDDYDDFTDLL